MKTNDLIFDRSFVNVKWANQKKHLLEGLSFLALAERDLNLGLKTIYK